MNTRSIMLIEQLQEAKNCNIYHNFLFLAISDTIRPIYKLTDNGARIRKKINVGKPNIGLIKDCYSGNKQRRNK